MKVKFIRLIRDSKGKPVLGARGPGETRPVLVEPHLLGGAVPGYLVTYPQTDGQPGRIEHIPADNVERAELELETEPAAAPKKPGK